MLIVNSLSQYKKQIGRSCLAFEHNKHNESTEIHKNASRYRLRGRTNNQAAKGGTQMDNKPIEEELTRISRNENDLVKSSTLNKLKSERVKRLREENPLSMSHDMSSEAK